MNTQAVIDAIKRNIDEGMAIVEDALDQDKKSPRELARRVNQFVSLGDQAKGSAQTFYATAGRFCWHLKESKPAGISFDDYLLECGANVRRRRADELIAIWEKRTNVETINERAKQTMRRTRAKRFAQPTVDTVEENEREQAEFEAEIEPQHRRAAFLLRADQAAAFAFYSGPVDREILQAARAPMQAWRKLVTTLNGRQRK